ncbi:Light dependent period protein LdpA domain-containing protein [Pleurocapsa sp. FMAR1]|uniref:Light dependent period protein LdpA domain-containing protein n=1 Tax=Pleurocapsa sp. FMAR1 TaxID=3040204 RepID=UPI0039AF357F
MLGSWFKLICGASYQHLPAVRSLAVAYSLAGADCIDVAADPAVIAAAIEGIEVAQKLQQKTQLLVEQNNYDSQAFSLTPTPNPQPLISKDHSAKTLVASPWLMVSINDEEDPHFRKAEFDATLCPQDCPQPCVQLCPAEAIDLNKGGILDSLCYGCGRCLPICPQELITTRSHVSNVKSVVSWVQSLKIDAIEIHTQVGHYEDFKRVWTDLAPIVGQLKLLAISCTDAPDVLNYWRSLYELITPLPCPLIWQTDGRSMSGDIGKGTTHAAIAFAQKVLQAKLPGYVQLAGGTNSYTVDKLKQSKMLRQQNSSLFKSVAGVAYGSYARAILAPVLNQLETTELQNIQSNLTNKPMNQLNLKLEQNIDLLEQAVTTASELVDQIKK